jgi:ATP-binding cassette, subfamily A (ABC1), member 3
MGQMKHFEKLFEALDAQKGALGVQTYGVSITTMEEVFLRVAHLGDDTALKSLKHDEQNAQPLAAGAPNLDDFDLSHEKIQGALNLFFTHMRALIAKRLLYFKRDLRGVACEIFLPILIIIIGLAILLI